MQSKNISVVKPGAGANGASEAYEISISPGHTGNQVIEGLKLNGYVLSSGDGRMIDMTADLFPLVEKGEKIHATTSATVGVNMS